MQGQQSSDECGTVQLLLRCVHCAIAALHLAYERLLYRYMRHHDSCKAAWSEILTACSAVQCRLAWADLERRCLAKLIVQTSRVLDFNYETCAPQPKATNA